MSNARKKVIVRRLSGETLPGYLPLSGFVRGMAPDQAIELLDLSGRIVAVTLREVKMVSFVRDFNLADTVNPERMTRRTFLARPRNEGLWLRLTLRTAEREPEVLEGLAAMDLSLLDSIM